MLNPDPSNVDPLDSFHPLVAQWFREKFPDGPTEPQREAWPHIQAEKDVLVSAPTGSGKTLTAFLAGIDSLIKEAAGGQLRDEVRILYLSPLKALANDIDHNLTEPLIGLGQFGGGLLGRLPEIRTAIRTGDTSQEERRRIIRKPPHILNTTPESLHLMMSSKNGRRILRTVTTVIVDEIHDLITNKRGTHLALALARLDAYAWHRPTRIGLSATQKPLADVAAFLAGNYPDGTPLPTQIVDLSSQRQAEVWVESVIAPDDEEFFFNRVHVMDRLADLIDQHQLTLVFVPSKGRAERYLGELRKRLEGNIAVHHGSLSREQRERTEEQLKEGVLRAVVSTSTLELGIDIGNIDLVCQVGSPKRIATFLQRVGRSGRARGAIPKGALFPTNIDEWIESATLVRAIGQGKLDQLQQPRMPLDVLAQHVVGEAVGRDGVPLKELFDIIRRTAQYRHLRDADFVSVLVMLHQGIENGDTRTPSLIDFSANQSEVRPTEYARKIVFLNSGVIIDDGEVKVFDTEGTKEVGTLDESFAESLMQIGRFQLAQRTWRFLGYDDEGNVLATQIKHAKTSADSAAVAVFTRKKGKRSEVGKLASEYAETLSRGDEFRIKERLWRVEATLHKKEIPVAEVTVEPPVWQSEGQGRSFEFSELVGEFRRQLSESTLPSVASVDLLHRTRRGGRRILGRLVDQLVVEHLARSVKILGAMPSDRTVVCELTLDHDGSRVTITHCCFGQRINRAFAAIMKEAIDTQRDGILTIREIDDDRFVLTGHCDEFFDSLLEWRLPGPTQSTVQAKFESLARNAAASSNMWQTRWRRVASIAFGVLRIDEGRKIPIVQQQAQATALSKTVLSNPSLPVEWPQRMHEPGLHPFLRQTQSDVMHEAMDIDGLWEIWKRILQGEIEVRIVRSTQMSQMATVTARREPWKRPENSRSTARPTTPERPERSYSVVDERTQRHRPSRPQRLPPHRR